MVADGANSCMTNRALGQKLSELPPRVLASRWTPAGLLSQLGACDCPNHNNSTCQAFAASRGTALPLALSMTTTALASATGDHDRLATSKDGHGGDCTNNGVTPETKDAPVTDVTIVEGPAAQSVLAGSVLDAGDEQLVRLLAERA